MDKELYVLTCERDTWIPEENSRPIVFEQFLDQGAASLERVKAFQKQLGNKFGKTRIARLQFVEED